MYSYFQVQHTQYYLLVYLILNQSILQIKRCLSSSCISHSLFGFLTASISSGFYSLIIIVIRDAPKHSADNINIGRGEGHSATIGAIIVVSLAKKLQIPKAVAATFELNICAVAIYTTLNAAEIPNLHDIIKIGVKKLLSSPFLIKSRPLIPETMNIEHRVIFVFRPFCKIPLKTTAASSEIPDAKVF